MLIVPPCPGRQSSRPFRTTPELTLDDQGTIPIPRTPGMGLELDWKYILTHRPT